MRLPTFGPLRRPGLFYAEQTDVFLFFPERPHPDSSVQAKWFGFAYGRDKMTLEKFILRMARQL